MSGRRLPGLTPVLRRSALGGIAAGGLGSAPFLALGAIAGSALGLTPWVLLAVGLIFLVVALSYAEGLAAAPEAGGSSSLVRRAFGDQMGFAAGWLALLDYAVLAALACVAAPHYLAAALDAPALARSPGDVLVGLALVGLVATTRLVRRVRLHRVAVGLALAALTVHLVVAGLGLVLLGLDGALVAVAPGEAPTWRALVVALPLAALAYTGLEAVANLAAEARDPGRDLPRGLVAGVAVVIGLNVLLGLVAVSAGVPEAGEGALAAPIAGVVAALEGALWSPAAEALRVFVGLTGALVLVALIATVFSGTGRLAYSLGQREMLPHACARLNRRTLIAPATVVGASLVVAALILVAGLGGGAPADLAALYGFGILAVATLVQLAVVRMRRTEPGLPRPFRVPGTLPGGVPALPLAGLVVTAALWIALLATHPGVRLLGALWLLAGTVVFVASRRSERRPVLGSVDVARPDLVPTPMPEYRRILVPLTQSAIGDELLATAVRIAAENEAAIHVLNVMRVPMDAALDAPLPDQVARAEETLAEAQALAAEQGVCVAGRVVRARAIGEAILEEAALDGSDLIMLGSSPRWRRQSRFFSPTVDYVLRRAPCEVMVVAFPDSAFGDEAAEG